MLMLESVQNPLKTINYSLDSANMPQAGSKGPFCLLEWYTTYLNNPFVDLQIKVESSEAPLEHNMTIRRLYNDEATSDVAVRCGALVIKAHKLILGALSETLRTAFSNPSCVEGQSGVYEIATKHLSPDILECVIRWMYLHSIEYDADKAWVYRYLNRFLG
jgi:hypothetical protein